jgi:hypothetical protein
MKSIHRPKYVKLIEKLVELRNVHGVTQVELALRLKKPQSYVAKVEALDRRLDVIELADWLNAIGEAPSTFMARITWWK